VRALSISPALAGKAPYRVCQACDLRYSADEPKCPRCATASPGQPLPSYELAGFVALPDETPILDEEERYAEPLGWRLRENSGFPRCFSCLRGRHE
jgi:hypothetical protein